MTRLEQLKELLAKADPIEDRFYIEDLQLSIEYQEMVEKVRYGSGFEMENKE